MQIQVVHSNDHGSDASQRLVVRRRRHRPIWLEGIQNRLSIWDDKHDQIERPRNQLPHVIKRYELGGRGDDQIKYRLTDR